MATAGVDILGSLELVTAASGDPVDMDVLRTFCRVVGNDNDDELNADMLAACAYIEQEIDGTRCLRQTTFDLPVSDWWDCPLKLPKPPLNASGVTYIHYRDTDGDTQTVSTDDYLVRTAHRQPGTIELLWLVGPPLYPYVEYPITIRYAAGYTSGSVPAVLQQAIKMLVRAWFDNVAMDEKLTTCIANLCAKEGWGGYA